MTSVLHIKFKSLQEDNVDRFMMIDFYSESTYLSHCQLHRVQLLMNYFSPSYYHRSLSLCSLSYCMIFSFQYKRHCHTQYNLHFSHFLIYYEEKNSISTTWNFLLLKNSQRNDFSYTGTLSGSRNTDMRAGDAQ